MNSREFFINVDNSIFFLLMTFISKRATFTIFTLVYFFGAVILISFYWYILYFIKYLFVWAKKSIFLIKSKINWFEHIFSIFFIFCPFFVHWKLHIFFHI